LGTLVEERPQAVACAESLKALAHPVRLRVIAALCEREESVIGLSHRLEVPQAILSQQLRILRMADLVTVKRENGFALYALARPQLRNLIACIEKCHGEAAAGGGGRR
jgi:ArsR family transcriptional regulator